MKQAFINGKIYTVNSVQEWEEAFIVENNIITHVGSNASITSLIDSDTTIIDLEYKMVLPGFIDAHAHPFLGNILLNTLQIDQTLSPSELYQLIQNYVSNNPHEELYVGMGFMAKNFGNDGPKAIDLDKIVSDKPMIFLDEGSHSMWVNSFVLKTLNITKDTPDPIIGADYYKRDNMGNPTGWIVEAQSMKPIAEHFKLIDLLFKDTDRLFKLFASFGITSFFNASEYFIGSNSPKVMEFLDQRAKNNQATMRFFTSYSYNNHYSSRDAYDVLKEQQELFNTDYVRIDTMKIWYDGTIEARTAAMLKPYSDDLENFGELFYPEKELQQVIQDANNYGFNVHVHAIGDKAITSALDAFIKANNTVPCKTPTIQMIAHVEASNPEIIQKFSSSGISANTTPAWHCFNDNVATALGKDRYQHTFMFKSLIKEGVLTTFGSDFPASGNVEILNVFKNIQIGHTRQDIGETKKLPTDTECLTIKDLIAGYTINAAKQLRMEHKLGSIEVGKYADFIILKENLFKQSPDKIHQNHVIKTYFDGQLIYQI